MSGAFFKEQQEYILQRIIISSCSLSVIGTILIILSYVLWPDIRSPLRRLLVYLSIADLLTASGNLVGVFYNGRSQVICSAQSFVTTYSSMSSFLWTMCVAIYLYLVISKRHKFALKLTFLFHLICWGLPLMIVCLATGFNALGYDEFSGSVGWCWISSGQMISWPSDNGDVFWKIVAGKGIETITYIFTPIIYIASKRELAYQHYDQRLHLNTNVRTTLQDTDRKLVLIPLIFVGLRVWGSLRLIPLPTLELDRIYGLAVLQGMGDSAQGWANCLLYCIFTRKIREKFIKLGMDLIHCKIYPCRETEEEVVDNEIST